MNVGSAIVRAASKRDRSGSLGHPEQVGGREEEEGGQVVEGMRVVDEGGSQMQWISWVALQFFKIFH